MLLWSFPLDLSEAERLALVEAEAPARSMDRAVQHALHGRWTDAQNEARRAMLAPGGEGDRATLLHSVLLTREGRFAEARTLALTRLPYLQGDRAGTAAAYLTAAEASLQLGFLDEAARLCAEATEAARSPAAYALRIPARLMWSEVNSAQGDGPQALVRARVAERVRLTPLERHCVDTTLARLLRADNPLGSLTRYHSAICSAPTPSRRYLLTEEQREVQRQLSAPLPLNSDPPPVPRQIRLQLLDGVSIRLGQTSLPAPTAAQAVLLLVYLQNHSGTNLAVLADLLLSQRVDDTNSRQLPAEALSIARIRRLLTRARSLIGDPAAVTCHAGAAYLSPRYHWSSDFHDALQDGSYQVSRLPPGLHCEWLDQLQALNLRS